MAYTRKWWLTATGIVLMAAAPLSAQRPDPARYMRTDEVRRGMKGFGRTVLSGTEIVTFQVEVISVMRNAFYPQQDVILIRCAGANLEHSGIVGGMSGSPVFLTDDQGQNPRMIGAVAYGWSFNKDPVCGVQPIHQMLGIQDAAETRPAETRTSASASSRFRPKTSATLAGERFAALFDSASAAWPAAQTGRDAAGTDLRPLATPIMVSGASPRALSFLRERLEDTGFEPVASGAADAVSTKPARLEPGATLAIPLMRGDSQMNAIGTCTEVIGDRVLGFGHAFFASGSIELPMGPGMIHTVVASVMRSNKLGAALEPAGALVRDETTGVAGRLGPVPRMVPCDVIVREPGRMREYHYECAQHVLFTPMLLGMAVMSSITSHNELPREHTLRYSIEMAFQDVGTFRSSNIASQSGETPIAMDVFGGAMAMAETPFGKARVERVRVEVTIEPVARTAWLERAELSRNRVKPGETIEVRAWWQPYRAPRESRSYAIQVPPDLPEGAYELTLCSARDHARALRSEKPHLFRIESMNQILAAMNLLAQFREDHVYLRLSLPTGGLSLGREALPELPSFRQRILADSKRTDVSRFTDALVVEHPAPFVVSGSRSFAVRVDKRADQ